MPLIDDHTRGTERRPKAYWPWLLVLVGFVVLWLGATTLVSVVPQLRLPAPNGAAVASAPPPHPRVLMNRAQAALSAGDPVDAVQLIDQIPANAALSVMDKHSYFRIAARVKRKSGDPIAAAGFYERFLAMGVGVGQPECRGCHAGGSTPPARASDLEASTLGTDYVAALRAAGLLKAARQRLRSELETQPADTRAHLLLFHIEKALGHARAAAEHADALKEASFGP